MFGNLRRVDRDNLLAVAGGHPFVVDEQPEGLLIGDTVRGGDLLEEI